MLIYVRGDEYFNCEKETKKEYITEIGEKETIKLSEVDFEIGICAGSKVEIVELGAAAIDAYVRVICFDPEYIVFQDGVTEIPEGMCQQLLNLHRVTIPDSVDRIEKYAFYQCSSLDDLLLPNSVTVIGNSAFAGCSSLRSVTIPGAVASIGFLAFEDCVGLTNVIIDDGVTNISSGAFRGCSGLSSVTFNGTLNDWKEIEISPSSFDWGVIICCSDDTVFFDRYIESY